MHVEKKTAQTKAAHITQHYRITKPRNAANAGRVIQCCYGAQNYYYMVDRTIDPGVCLNDIHIHTQTTLNNNQPRGVCVCVFCGSLEWVISETRSSSVY